MELAEKDKIDIILSTKIVNQLGISLTGVAYIWDNTVIFDDTVKLNNSPLESVMQFNFCMKEIALYINMNQSIPRNKLYTVPESNVHLDTNPADKKDADGIKLISISFNIRYNSQTIWIRHIYHTGFNCGFYRFQSTFRNYVSI